jgi:long-chain acyl-CoA synthetase
MNRTIPYLFESSVATFPRNVMMWEKKGEKYEGAVYTEIHAKVTAFAAGLMSLGIQKGDRIALIAEGRNDWVISELGMLYAGAINVPMSVKLNEPADLKFRLAHSGTRMVIASGSQSSKITGLKKDLPDLERVIHLDPLERYAEDEISFSDVMEQGKRFLASQKEEFKKRWLSIEEDHPANICYTSGTTADPKGVVLTHRNYTANVEQASTLLPIPEYYCSLLILPWDHCFAHTAGVYTLMKNGASMASVQVGKTPMETLKNIPVNIKETHPTFLLSVPTLAKNFRKNIENGIRQKGPAVEKLFQKALKVAYEYNGNGYDRGKGMRMLKKPLYMLFDKIIFSKIRENFGARLEFFIGGGALLDIELQKFFYAIGIPMFQGYGLTESTPIISSNVPKKHKLGSSGSLVENLQLKICDENGKELPLGVKGEIVVKGENVMAGYWKNEKATKETVKDGWLYTGDMGYMDKDGFLYVLGRFKSLLISNDGEKYSPEGIEEMIVSKSKYIDQIMLYNNQSPYTTALIVPNKDAVLRWAKEKNLSCQSEGGQNEILRMLEGEIDAYKENGLYGAMFPSRWIPAAIAVLGEGFTEQNGFMNTTLKIVRGKIEEFYRNRIDYLYTAEGKDVRNHQNKMIVKRMEE